MKKIMFYPKDKIIAEVVLPPQKVSIPEWFKKMPLHTQNEKKLRIKNGETNLTAKVCMPFLDSFTTGYVFNLHCDINVELNAEGEQTVHWNNNTFVPVFARPLNEKIIPARQGFDDWNFSWTTYWGIKLPKGYSALLTHPLNRTDLPFVTTSGILDADKWGIWGNQPFSFVQGFQGVIPKGTPIIQIIPFKRHSWISKINNKLSKWANLENLKLSSKFRGYYKDMFWSKKEYE